MVKDTSSDKFKAEAIVTMKRDGILRVLQPALFVF